MTRRTLILLAAALLHGQGYVSGKLGEEGPPLYIVDTLLTFYG